MTIVVIGGGAAGFFGAINAAMANANNKVILIEKSSKLLAKVRVSGGGRCNVTHHCFDNKQLAQNYPRGNKELLGAFNQFSVKDTIAWFETRGVRLKTEDDGRMFPQANTSEAIIHCLMNVAQQVGVDIQMNVAIKKIETTANNTFLLSVDNDTTIHADKLLIATGGANKISSYDWLSVLGHHIIAPVPSLFTFNIQDEKLNALMGVSVLNAKVKIVGTKLENEGPLLITHWGMSGPAILKLSAWGARDLAERNYSFAIQVNWLYDKTEQELKDDFEKQKQNQGAKIISNTKPTALSTRLWLYLLDKSNLNGNEKLADLNKKQIQTLIQHLIADEYKVNGKSTFKEEFVTCGGISLKEVDFKTMQSKIIPNLFFAGEVLDIDAVTGGFNFQAVWTTAWIAAKGITNIG